MSTNYGLFAKADANPDPASMIETFRAIGYSVRTAIADIVDNSISANAKNVYVNFIWKGGETSITVKDDGLGMSSLTFDWNQIAWIANPLVVPWWAQVNVFVSFVLFFW
ncbi:MAG: hypothetical protein EOP48_17265, partial [Sphingobacteriales bacterium]